MQKKKTLVKIQHPFMRKLSRKRAQREQTLNIINVTYDEPRIHILNREKLKASPKFQNEIRIPTLKTFI